MYLYLLNLLNGHGSRTCNNHMLQKTRKEPGRRRIANSLEQAARVIEHKENCETSAHSRYESNYANNSAKRCASCFIERLLFRIIVTMRSTASYPSNCAWPGECEGYRDISGEILIRAMAATHHTQRLMSFASAGQQAQVCGMKPSGCRHKSVQMSQRHHTVA